MEIILTILIIWGGFKLLAYIEKQAKEETRRRNILAAEEAEREVRKTPEHILNHLPTASYIKRILETTTDPAIKQLAINAALRSKDDRIISLIHVFAPEFRYLALRAHLDLKFENATDDECAVLLKEYKDWDTHPEWAIWWTIWRTKLEARAKRAAQRAEDERARQVWLAKLRQAEADGEDVCWRCENIKPERCRMCGHCISGCGNSYNGCCYNCNDD